MYPRTGFEPDVFDFRCNHFYVTYKYFNVIISKTIITLSDET